jgi:hypothetical protein
VGQGVKDGEEESEEKLSEKTQEKTDCYILRTDGNFAKNNIGNLTYLIC